jgi:hypothetical protein
MPRKAGYQSERCSVCLHEQVGPRNYALARGTTIAAVAREYGFHERSVRTHFRDHITENYKSIIGSGIYKNIDELLKACIDGNAESLDVLNALISGLFHSWGVAFSNGDSRQMIQYSSQLRQLIELRAKLTSELAPAHHLHSSLTVNAFSSDTASMVAGIARALQPFPEARLAVMNFLHPEQKVKVIEHAGD